MRANPISLFGVVFSWRAAPLPEVLHVEFLQRVRGETSVFHPAKAVFRGDGIWSGETGLEESDSTFTLRFDIELCDADGKAVGKFSYRCESPGLASDEAVSHALTVKTAEPLCLTTIIAPTCGDENGAGFEVLITE